MDDFTGAVIFTVILLFVLTLFFKRKAVLDFFRLLRKKNIELLPHDTYSAANFELNNPLLNIELQPLTRHVDENELFEITDQLTIERISQTIPGVAQLLSKTITMDALTKAGLFQVIIPSGATLAKSKGLAGAVRGFFHTAEGIGGHANLKAVDPSNISKISNVANSVANMINIASMVVGQYYMSEINKKLAIVNKTLGNIHDFQEREFKSRIFALISIVHDISNYNSEIIVNDELRNRKLIELDNCRATAIELLTNVNSNISSMCTRECVKYKEYENSINEIDVLLEYQDALLSVLKLISELIYFLNRGGMSMEMSHSLFKSSYNRSLQVIDHLKRWHLNHVETLNIDLENERVKKKGWRKVLSFVPGILDDSWNYRKMEKVLVEKLSAQTGLKYLQQEGQAGVLDSDVEIIIKEGKLYYLKKSVN